MRSFRPLAVVAALLLAACGRESTFQQTIPELVEFRYLCGRFVEPRPHPQRLVMADLVFEDQVAPKSRIRALGGEVLYAFDVNALRVGIPAGRIPDVDGLDHAYGVTDPGPLVIDIVVHYSRPVTGADAQALNDRGAIAPTFLHGESVITARAHDADIPEFRQLAGVTRITAKPAVCGG